MNRSIGPDTRCGSIRARPCNATRIGAVDRVNMDWVSLPDLDGTAARRNRYSVIAPDPLYVPVAHPTSGRKVSLLAEKPQRSARPRVRICSRSTGALAQVMDEIMPDESKFTTRGLTERPRLVCWSACEQRCRGHSDCQREQANAQSLAARLLRGHRPLHWRSPIVPKNGP